MKYLPPDPERVVVKLKQRDVNTHKGDYGRILLLCGSVGYTGAAALCAMGALRTGSGLVYLGVPEPIYGIEAVKLTEPIVMPLEHDNGRLSVKSTEQILPLLDRMDAVAIGPGLGVSTGTKHVIKTVLKNFSGPGVLDADGINCLSEHKDILRDRTGATILTPHEGELARFLGHPLESREEDAIRTAREYGVVLLLKGHETIVTDGITTYVNHTGNPGMAVGGCGDLLTGMIVSMLGQNIPALDAAVASAWLHGKAGDICARELGQCAMLPSDMLNVLPRLFK